jgi:hypothetical protein
MRFGAWATGKPQAMKQPAGDEKPMGPSWLGAWCEANKTLVAGLISVTVAVAGILSGLVITKYNKSVDIQQEMVRSASLIETQAILLERVVLRAALDLDDFTHFVNVGPVTAEGLITRKVRYLETIAQAKQQSREILETISNDPSTARASLMRALIAFGHMRYNFEASLYALERKIEYEQISDQAFGESVQKGRYEAWIDDRMESYLSLAQHLAKVGQQSAIAWIAQVGFACTDIRKVAGMDWTKGWTSRYAKNYLAESEDSTSVLSLEFKYTSAAQDILEEALVLDDAISDLEFQRETVFRAASGMNESDYRIAIQLSPYGPPPEMFRYSDW